MNNILVIRLGAIGDVVLTTAPIINLKLSFPDSRIHVLTREYTAPLLEHLAAVDDIIALPRKITALCLFKTAEMLDQKGFDLVCDLHGNIRSKIISRYISAPRKVQYPKRRLERMAAVKRHRLIENPPHTIDLYNQAVEEAGGNIFCRRPILDLPQNTGNSNYYIENNLPVVAVAPGASYPAKQWPLERFKELVRRIISEEMGNVLLLLPEKDRAMQSLAEELPGDRLKIIINADLITLARAIEASDIMISNDSGLAHIGSAVGTPVLALFGPTHPTFGFAPRGLRDRVVQVDEPCRPCSLHGQKDCFRDRQYCFTRIEVDHVLANIREMLDNHAKGERAIFIDRDGTLIKEKNFISSPVDVEPETGAIDAVRAARRAGYKIIVISNQSGVARGYFDEQAVEAVNNRVKQLFADQNAPLDDIFYCPYYKGGTVPSYTRHVIDRKPGSGMVDQAAQRHNINPFRSFIVGDKLTDCALAHVVGARGILVRTGYGRDQEAKMGKGYVFRPERIVNNLGDAVDYIAGNSKGIIR